MLAKLLIYLIGKIQNLVIYDTLFQIFFSNYCIHLSSVLLRDAPPPMMPNACTRTKIMSLCICKRKAMVKTNQMGLQKNIYI